MNRNLRCPRCGGALETYEGERYCSDCTAYALTHDPEEPPVTTLYREGGLLFRAVGLVPYSELTPGDRYVIPGGTVVHTRRPSGPPQGELARVLAGLYHRQVILVELDDRPVDLVDGEPPF